MNNKKLVPVAIAVIALACAFLIYKIVGGGGDSAGGVSNDELSAQVPKPDPGAPDLGPIDDRFVIGKSPGGPSTPGAGGK